MERRREGEQTHAHVLTCALRIAFSGLLTLDNASPPSRGLGDLLQRRQVVEIIKEKEEGGGRGGGGEEEEEEKKKKEGWG